MIAMKISELSHNNVILLVCLPLMQTSLLVLEFSRFFFLPYEIYFCPNVEWIVLILDQFLHLIADSCSCMQR